jgi:tight adherence protein B
MSQALRAGHSLANAILLISQQLPDPVGTEFARVFHEQNLGIKIEDALKDMAKRVGLMDVRFFVTAVLLQRQTGGDLAEVLDNISGVIRERIKLFGTVRALTAEGRLSGYVQLALPVCVFMLELVINPQYAQIMIDEPMGQYMLIGAGVAQVLGLAMIQKIVNIKV